MTALPTLIDKHVVSFQLMVETVFEVPGKINCHISKFLVETASSFVSMAKLREVHPRVNGDL